MRLITLLAVFLFSIGAFGQNEKDSILMLNGKVYYGEVIGSYKVDGDSILKYKETNKKGETEEATLDLYRVYSYTSKSTNNVIYRQDEFLGNYLTVEQTKEVTIGSYDARQTFKPRIPFWTTYALGAGISIMDTYLGKKKFENPSYINPYGHTSPGLFKDKLSLLPVLVPVVVSVTWSLPSFKLKKKKMLHLEYFNNENYYRGYHRIAKQKRMLGSLAGGFAGIATGWIAHLIVNGF